MQTSDARKRHSPPVRESHLDDAVRAVEIAAAAVTDARRHHREAKAAQARAESCTELAERYIADAQAAVRRAAGES